jgi:hypothetical protein
VGVLAGFGPTLETATDRDSTKDFVIDAVLDGRESHVVDASN